MRKVQRKAKVCTVHQMAVDSSEFERCSFSLKFSIQDRFRTFTRILLKTCVRSLYGCEPLLLYVTDTLKVIDTSVLWYCFTFFFSSFKLFISFRFSSSRSCDMHVYRLCWHCAKKPVGVRYGNFNKCMHFKTAFSELQTI